MATLIQTVERTARELRRADLSDDIRVAILEVIEEATSERIFFTELYKFPIVVPALQEYVSDEAFIEVDCLYYFRGTSRCNLILESNETLDMLANGSNYSSEPDCFSRFGGFIRLYPVPVQETTIFLDGVGKLPALVNDEDSNEWLTAGERYVRAAAKAQVLKDVIKDYREAAVLDAIAADYMARLMEDTTRKSATGLLRATQW